MLSQLTNCAQNLWARLSSAANQFLRDLVQPCAGYHFDPPAFLANAGLLFSLSVIVVQHVQHWASERAAL
jgi:hypothetical protein